MCVCVQNNLLCKFVSQKLQLWTAQMLTNVEAAAPFFENERKRKKYNSCNKGAILKKNSTALCKSLNLQCVVYRTAWRRDV